MNVDLDKDMIKVGLRNPAALASVFNDALESVRLVHLRGRVKQVVGTVIRATAPSARIGELCLCSPHHFEKSPKTRAERRKYRPIVTVHSRI